MDEFEDEDVDVPVLRLNPLPDEDGKKITGKKNKYVRNVVTPTIAFGRTQSFLSDNSRSHTPDRLVFPGQYRPKSAGCMLRELKTPTIGRQRNSMRPDPEPEEVRYLPDAPKKVSRDELETIVSRLQRQTNSGRARTALTRRINQKRQEQSKNLRVDYLAFDPYRFRGLRRVTKDEMDSIVNRLSTFPNDRKPAESERYSIGKENHEKLGVLNSYRWKGIRASSGIGESTALLFAESKAKVVLAARNVENLEKVASLCKTKGLSDSDINNAGKGTIGNVMATPEATLDDIMNVNFKSIYNLSRLCVPHLTKNSGVCKTGLEFGSIVNVSSIAGQRAGPNISAYCISKAALDMFTRVLALELAHQKVRVNSVNPGFILTPFAENAGWPSDMTTNYLERLKVLQPLGGAGKPEDVAKAIRFLASDEASFTTGHLLFVDSGRHCGLPV
ncbi:unnamed protein product [Mytilus coruscus]|uniref:Uncharacterized protein n=1 Tax=Mytilus coruscus TaxID=42192 RepID=A0A6J8CKV5_MYTCO|nr:unnamed protein product [Mytilus coruscus]